MSDTESVTPTSSSERALVLGIQLFRVVGGVLLAFFLIGVLTSFFELRLRDPVSEMRFSGQMADRIPMVLLALALLFGHPRFLRKKFESKILWIVSGFPLGLAILYALLIPLTMFSAANSFRMATYGLEQQVEEQLRGVRAVRDATLNLPADQQQEMADRYNRANPKKTPADLPTFLKTLNEEVKSSETRLEQERRKVLGMQQRTLYASQFVQSIKLLVGAVAFLILWRLIHWARPAGQRTLRQELANSRLAAKFTPSQGMREG